MPCDHWGYLALCLVALQFAMVSGYPPLPSKFYQYGRGLMLETWLPSTEYRFDDFNKIPYFPNCPTYASNLNTFQYTKVYSSQQHNRFRAYFVSPQDGKHKFSVLFNNKVRIMIEINPGGFKNIYESSSATGTNWANRKWTSEVDLKKGFRYLLMVYHYGNGQWPEHFYLGVHFPDNTEVQPLDSRYLWRSMEFYKWNGVLGQKYDSVSWPSDRKMSTFYSLNSAKYPNNPMEFTCGPSLYEPFQSLDDYYAILFIGYMKPTTNGDYTFRMYCNEICELFLTKNNVEKSYGTADLGGPKVVFNIGQLQNDTLYAVRAARVEGVGSDYIQVEHKHDSGSYSDSWNGLLQNLATNETVVSLSPPTPVMINSTAINATLTSPPYIPPRDNWTYVDKYDMLYFETNNAASSVVKFEFTGSMPRTIHGTNLKKYTDYTFYAHYYGYINGTIEHHIITRGNVMKTDEDVPDAPPPGIMKMSISSKSIRVTWRSYVDPIVVNGICNGYEVQYAIKNLVPKNWTSVIVSDLNNKMVLPTDLEEYTTYEFKIAGRTSKGSGVFSAPVEEKTKEDKPSAPPTNISATNTSSSSIFISWQDVPFWDQNGIITQYKVYIRKNGDAGPWGTGTTANKYFAKTGLDLWENYDVKVSAFTSIGEGPESAALTVRTDEDKPGASPIGVTTTAKSSTTVNVTWSDVIPTKTYGVITSYSMKYKRTDGRGIEKEVIVFEKSSLISGLDKYVEYDIKVAGMTSKGAGVYSVITKQRTLKDVPSLPPLNLRGTNISSTAIEIFWDAIPTDDRNGIITGYNVKYKDKLFSTNWKNVTVNDSTLTLTTRNLDYYRLYEFRVAGMTAVGIGIYSSIVVIRTDADGPSKSPMNFTGHFASHTALNMSWTRVPKANRHGIVFGYRIYYRDQTIPNATWRNITIPNRHNGSDAFSTIIGGLKIYTPYLCKITAFTYKSEGVFSKDITVWTDEYVPIEPPRNLTGQNASSTEIVLDWISMAEVHGDANGKVLGYTVKYQVVDCHEDRPAGCNESQVFEVKSIGDNSTTIIKNLRKYTEYRLSIQVFNSKGIGNFTKQIITKTAEDKPDAPPTIVETWPAQYESIKVFWSPIPESLRNGIIRGYRIFYRPLDVPLHKYHRAPRSVNPFAAYGGLPGEKMKEVNASFFQTEINGLKHYSWYHIRIGAFTSKGIGATFSINGTCKQSTPITAPKMEVIDKYDFYEITLKWIEINKTHGNGEVLGYRIKYWLVELQDTIEYKLNEYYVDTLAPNKTISVKNLKPYGRYGFTIAAFTEGGIGVESATVFGETCRCPKHLSSARMIFPPLIHGSLNSLEILPKFVDEAVTHCCGNCSRGHGVSEIDWKRDWFNASSLKYNSQSILEAAVAGTHITMPLFRDTMEAAGDGSVEPYVYVPILEARKLAIFTRQLTKEELGNAASGLIAESLWEQYPLFVTSAVIIILAGILFWFFEHGKNTEEFSGSYVKGSGSGVWLTYITMTTVGYGDLTPITVKGKIHAMIVMLVGLVLTSMLVGNLCSLVSIDFVLSPPPFEANGKVLTSDDTLMLASRLFGSKIVLGNTSDPIFVQKQLLSGNVSKLAIETYQAVLLKDVLDSSKIKLEAVQDIEASYGIALAGEAKRVKQCVSRYARQNSQQMLLRISNDVFTFKVGGLFHAELLEHMTSPHSSVMTNLTTFGGIILVILTIMGTMFEIIRKRRARAKVGGYPDATDSLFNDVSKDIEVLENDINASVSEIEARHTEERIKLSKMQMGKYEALLKMYPDLPTFDPSIPKLNKQNEEALVPMSNFNIEESEEDEDSLIDMPIDYKRSRVNLHI